jgi:hypothetical protein
LLAEEYKERGIAFNVGFGEQTEMLEESFPGYQAPPKRTKWQITSLILR